MRAVYGAGLAAIVVATAVPAASPPLPAFAAAVMRSDGTMIPIGTFTGRHWAVSWPAESYEKVDIPITTASVPKDWWGKPGVRQEWQLWSEGMPRRTVHVIAPKVVGTMCTGRVGLLTDYRGPEAPPPSVQPYPKAGIAVSPPGAAVARIEILEATSPEWQGIAAPLKQAFDDEEDKLAAEWTRAGDPHPIVRKERLQTPLAVEAMYATDDGLDRVYYVEASRKYDHSADDRALCAFAFGSVYFRKAGSTVHPLGGEMKVVPCNRRGLVYMLPLGAIRLGDALFWITQYSGWDFEQYNIIEIKRSRVEVAASTFGGRCPSERN